ncbi:transposase [Streptomyces sp. NPDC090093]|uniref:transposase n=1 Tax=Streptomyces sp. NPDC090093 TaxID=3365945 RepID=UPI00380C1F5B
MTQLPGLREELYSCLTTCSDTLFKLADAVSYEDGPVKSLAEPTLADERRRSHGVPYTPSPDRVDAEEMRQTLASMPLPRTTDNRLLLAFDSTYSLRLHAHTSPQRPLCHTYGRGQDQHIPVPGWLSSIVRRLEPGPRSSTASLDGRRLAPGDDVAIAATQELSDLVKGLITGSQ